MPETHGKGYCVIGHPIGHTLSPLIHETVFRHFGLDHRYEAVHVLPGGLADFVRASRRSGRPGFNVTLPHKETIVPLLDETDTLASSIGAVNTVVRRSRRLVGYNTDVQGFAFSLKASGWEPSGPALVLGAGGAARAVLEALASMGVPETAVSDRIADKASALAAHVEKRHPRMRVVPVPPHSDAFWSAAARTHLFVNATPVGMWPRTEDIPFEPDRLNDRTMVFDLVPKPIRTEFLKRAESLGLRTIPGIRMLVAQALEADALFLRRTIPDSLYASVERNVTALEKESLRA